MYPLGWKPLGYMSDGQQTPSIRILANQFSKGISLATLHHCWRIINLFADYARCSPARDRKSTRLNSSHVAISYAVFCLKKKNKQRQDTTRRGYRTTRL